jgi:asparagine synthase (glutamine-hydrolysing)
MCGLVGVASKSFQSDRAWLASARDTLAHRGPDDAGEWWSAEGLVGLAHRRLSIRDLSPLGRQPMHLTELGLTIVFNGEIYNFVELRRELEGLGHHFLSQSDTEVILVAYAHWGTECLERLNGMFAFAIYDAFRKELFLARDRVGEKPLFYLFIHETLFFSSELKALLTNAALPRVIDPGAMDCFLTMGFVPGAGCILANYYKLPPAHALRFSLQSGEVKVWRYWRLPELAAPANCANELSLVDEVEALLEDSVARQMVADVPVGILLSGGLDSSLVTAMAVRHSSNVRTFSIGFPGYGKLDETPHARLIARHFGTDHIELMAEPTTADLLPILARQFDEPIVDSSMFPTYLVSHLVRQYCAVALGGDGGDELFGGYAHYTRLLWLQRNLAHMPSWVRRRVAQGAEQLLPMGFIGRNYLRGLDVDLRGGLPNITRYFLATERRKLVGGLMEINPVAESIYSNRIPQQQDLLQRATRMDFENYLAEDILVKVDRASMLNSLEIRAPFLDYRLIEFAFGQVPSSLKATESDKKILLKKLAARVLPAEFDKKRKQGFSIPLREWLKRGPFRQLFWDTLTSSDCLFDGKTIRSLLEGQDKGRCNGERLFALVQFELWRKIYRVSL